MPGKDKLPNWLKWVIVIGTMALLAVVMLALNDRVSRVEMPAPDDTLGLNRTAATSAAPEQAGIPVSL